MDKKLKQLQISKDVWKMLKLYCSKEGYSMKGLVEKLIKAEVNGK